MEKDTIYDSPEKLHTKSTGIVKIVEVEKPWGKERLLVCTESYVMKFLHIDSGHRLSLQYHKKKRETLHCISGEAIAIVGDSQENLKKIRLVPGVTLHVEPGTVHTFESVTDTVLVETSTPEIDDVVRLKDNYGRQNN